MIPVRCKHIYTLIKSLLTIVCCFSSSIGFAQTGAIQLTNRNLLFVGESIPIKVAISHVGQKKVVVKVSNNIKYISTDNRDSITGLSKGVGLVTVGYKKRKDTVWVDSMHVRVKDLPPLRAKYGTIESGKRVHRNAIAIHRSIRVAYGPLGFPIKQQWKVVSFRIKIQGADSYKTFNLEGSEIPLYVGNYIRHHATGVVIVDRIIVQNKTTLSTKRLSPIFIEIASSKSRDQIRYVNANYIDKDQSHKQYDLITDDFFIDTIFQNIYSGTIVLFGFDYRFERIYDHGVIKTQSHYDQYGGLQYTMKRVDEHIWDFEEVDSSGAITLNTTINDTLVLYGAKEIQIYLDSPWFKIRDSTKLEYDLIAFYNRYKLCPIDSFTTRYPEGTTRLAGSLRLREGTHIPWDGPRCGNIGIDELVNDVSVMDGSWILYGKDGKVIDRREYELGVSKKE